jgi:hypothetical protein
MYQFSRPLVKGTDANTSLPVFGFVINDMFISAPTISSCSRFEVDPQVEYGLSPKEVEDLNALNMLLDTATQAALNHGCLAIQEALGIESGDVAGVHFSGAAQVAPVAQAMMDYIGSELNLAQAA